ncbi:MAG: VWA domain-containing protein [Acidobacteriota bacterium]|jgi:VWFA-related protein
MFSRCGGAEGGFARRTSVTTLAVTLTLAAVAAGAPATPQRQRFEATVSRVRVDVIVRDDDGNFVDDLQASDFRIFEDGEEQPLLGLQLVDLPAGLLVDRSRGEAAATELVANADPAAGTPSERSSDFGAMVFLVDFQNLDFKNKLRFTEAWEDLVAQTEGLQIPRAVYLINQVGELEELAPLTQDPELLLAAAEEVSQRSNVRKTLRDERIEDTLEGDEMVRQYRDRDKALYTYELLTQFAEGLSARSGRTALVWVSTGVTLMYGNAFWGGANETSKNSRSASPNPMILARQKAFHRAANSANVSVYTIDPTPKVEQVLGVADARFGPVAEGGDSPMSGLMVQGIELDAMRNSLRLAAKETGGESFIGWADLTQVLTEIEADTGRYYLLSYAAPSPEGDGDYHDIRVEVARDDVDVRARDGYFDYDAADRRSRFVSAALSLPGTVADLPLYAQATRTRDADGNTHLMLSLAVDADQLGIGVDDQGLFAGFEVHDAALDERLDVKEEYHGKVQRRLTPLAADDASIAAVARAAGLPAGELLVTHNEWTLPPDDYDVRAMILDENTGRVGSARVQVTVDKVEPGAWSTSDLLLIESDRSGKTRPVVAGRTPAGATVSAFLEVYNGVSPAVRGTIRAVDSPMSALGDGADIYFTPLYPDDDGIHRGAVLLPPLTPGTYHLRLEVNDIAAGQGDTFEQNIEVLEPPRR